MRPTFYVDLDCRPQSANAPKERPHAFKPGDSLWLAEDYPYEFGVIPAQTRFFVSHVAEEDGTMWLLAEGNVPALYYADNMLALVPWHTEDLLPYLRVAVRQPEFQVSPEFSHPSGTVPSPHPLPPSNVRQLGKLVLVACACVSLIAARPHGVTSDHLTHKTVRHAHWNNTDGNELTIRT